MVEIRNEPYADRVVVKRSNAGRNIAIVAVIIVAVVGLLLLPVLESKRFRWRRS